MVCPASLRTGRDLEPHSVGVLGNAVPRKIQIDFPLLHWDSLACLSSSCKTTTLWLVFCSGTDYYDFISYTCCSKCSREEGWWQNLSAKREFLHVGARKPTGERTVFGFHEQMWIENSILTKGFVITRLLTDFDPRWNRKKPVGLKKSSGTELVAYDLVLIVFWEKLQPLHSVKQE